MTKETIINTLALIFIPIIAVCIGQYLQDRAKKREDKMRIFQILMATRIYGWTNASVEALNLIEVIFSGEKKVIEQWKKYYDALCVENPNPTQLDKIKKEHETLLETMAISLGYKDEVTLRTIQSPYSPIGLADFRRKQEEFQNGQLELMKILLQKLAANESKMEEQQDGQNEL